MTAPALVRDLAAAARSEPRLVGIGLTDPRSMRDVIWSAFRRELAPWAELVYEQVVRGDEVMRRTSAPGGAAPGGAVLDFLVVANPARLLARGLLMPHEQPYRDRFPAGWVGPGGAWTPLYVQPVVVVVNQHHVQVPPARWTDLAEPDRVDRLVFEEPWAMLSTGPAFAELESALGATQHQSWLRAVAASEPLIVGDNERSVLEVATGSRWVGLSNWNVALRPRATSPVRHVFLDPTPCVPGFAALPVGGSSPNLAKLFLAWLGSPGGQQAYATTGRIPAMAGVDAPTALARIVPPGVEPLFGSVDWLGRPEPWIELYRSVFRSPAGALRRGKIGA